MGVRGAPFHVYIAQTKRRYDLELPSSTNTYVPDKANAKPFSISTFGNVVSVKVPVDLCHHRMGISIILFLGLFDIPFIIDQ